MGYSRDEQETTLVYDAEEDKWIGYSCYSPHITRLLKILGDNFEGEYEDGRESPVSIKFELKSNQVSFRTGKKRNISDEQRERMSKLARERFKKN